MAFTLGKGRKFKESLRSFVAVTHGGNGQVCVRVPTRRLLCQVAFPGT